MSADFDTFGNLPQITEQKVVEIADGDLLVVRVPHALSAKQRDALKSYMERITRHLTNVHVVVLDSGMDVSVIRKALMVPGGAT
jgi:hypothetical protein